MDITERAHYVTELVSRWIIGDPYHYPGAQYMATLGPDKVRDFLWPVVRMCSDPENTFLWYVNGELARHDYDRIDWHHVRDAILKGRS